MKSFNVNTLLASVGSFVLAALFCSGLFAQLDPNANPVGVDPSTGQLFFIGDFDRDGVVGVDDIDIYPSFLGQPAAALPELDLTGDGLILQDDFVFLVENFVQTSNGLRGTFLGDINFDGTVNLLGDAFIHDGNIGQVVTSYGQGDLNLDGFVDTLDFDLDAALDGIATTAILNQNLGQSNAGNPTIPSLAIPEPSSLAILAVGGCLGLIQRRKRR